MAALMGWFDDLASARDLASLAVALVPLGTYLLGIGLLHLRARPTLLSGTQDLLVLAIGLAGVMAVGPMELFMPEAAAGRFGSLIWLQLMLLYGLSVALAVMLMRPRLVIYNVTPEQLRPALERILHELDDTSHWAGDSVSLPQLGVHFHVERTGVLRQMQLVANGPRQSPEGWFLLRHAVRDELARVQVARCRRAGLLVAMALLVLVFVATLIAQDGQAIAEGLRDKLRW